MSERPKPAEYGSLAPEVLALLPQGEDVELTFVDDEDIYRYFTRLPRVIFERTPDILGTDVLSCHPLHSHNAVRRVLRDLRSGRRDEISKVDRKEGERIEVRYIAVRDPAGTYLGCVEAVRRLDD